MDELKVFLFRPPVLLGHRTLLGHEPSGRELWLQSHVLLHSGRIAQILDDSLNQLTGLLNTAGQNTPMPSVFAPMEIVCYCFVEGFLGIASGVLFC